MTNVQTSNEESAAQQPVDHQGAKAVTFTPRAKKKSRRIWWIILGVLILAGAGGGYGYWTHIKAATATTIDPSHIVPVIHGDLEKSVDSSGKIISNLDVDIKCRASGEVVVLPVDISQTVKKGDLLCQLDPTDEKLAVRSAEATVSQSAARLAQAKSNLEIGELNLATTRNRYDAILASAKIRAANLRSRAERQKQLSAQQLGSKEEMETAQTEAAAAESDQAAAEIAIAELKQQEIQLEVKRQDVKTAEAQLQQDQIGLDNQKQQLEYTTVVAPIDGTVSARNVQKGTIIASGTNAVNGGTAIMTLSDLSRLYMMATVDESDIGGVSVGQKARIVVDSFPNRTFAGKVVRIAVTGVNSSNVVTFEVKIEVLDEHKDLLKLQMTGEATIIQESKENVLVIPDGAVIHEGDSTFVKLPTGEKKAVKLGLDAADMVEVLSGVHEGERVVISSVEALSRWKKVRQEPGGAPAPH